MKKKSVYLIFIVIIISPSLLFSQNTDGFRLSMVNGYNSFLNTSKQDSVFFLKGGINLGLQGAWFSNNIGFSGKAGYLTNGIDNKKLSDFGTSRKATADRSQQNNSPYNGYYFMAGPAFKSDFKKLQVHTNIMAGMYSGAASQVFLSDKQATDITYYKNVVNKTSSFTWTAGMGADYSVTSNMQLGISTDYQSMKREVINYDILRGNGREAKNITGQVNFLNTAIRLTYLFGGKNHSDEQTAAVKKHIGNVKYNDFALKKFSPDKSEANTERKHIGNVKYNEINLKQQNDTNGNCENQVMEVAYFEPIAIDVSLNSMEDAQEFFKTCGAPFNNEEYYLKQKNNMQAANTNPMYKDIKMEGKNPLYQENDFAIKENGVKSVTSHGDDDVYKKNEFAIKENGVKSIVSPRDPASGMATGKRMHKPFPAYYEESTDTYELDGKYYVTTAREASSGMATGRRMHKPFPAYYDEETDTYELNGKYYVATAREASSGMATGRRMHKPFPAYYDEVTNTYELNGKYFVATAREASSGMATGRIEHLHKENIVHRDIAARNIVITADNSGTNLSENKDEQKLSMAGMIGSTSVLPASRNGMIIKDDKGKQFFALFPDEIDLKKLSQTDGGSIAINFTKSNVGPLKWMAPESLAHRNIPAEDDNTITTTNNPDSNSIYKQASNIIVSPRDNSSGLPTGKRMHKPIMINYDEESNTIIGSNGQEYSEIKTAREASSGMATGKRMHKPIIINYDAENNIIVDSIGTEYTEIKTARDAASGMATGKRMHKPYLVEYDTENNILIDSTGQEYTEIKTARDAGSGMATVKRMHKPFEVKNYSDNNEGTAEEKEEETASDVATGKYKISCSPDNIEYGEDGSRKVTGILYMNGNAYPAVFTLMPINDAKKSLMGLIR